MKVVKIDPYSESNFSIDILEYAFSPLEPKYTELQRIVNIQTNPKIKIFGKRLIKEENKYHSIKIFRIQEIFLN